MLKVHAGLRCNEQEGDLAVSELNVLVVEDEPLFRQLLGLALQEDPALRVCGSFSNGEEVLEKLDRLHFDVATLDIQLAGKLSGHDLGLILRQQRPHVGVVLLSNYMEPAFIYALRQHARTGWSYLLKHADIDIDTVRRAVKGAARGEIVIDPMVVAAMEMRPDSGLSRLTARELDVLRLMAEGYTNAAIAGQLHLTVKSVENVINRLFHKLDIDRCGSTLQPRVVAVLRYLEEVRLR